MRHAAVAIGLAAATLAATAGGCGGSGDSGPTKAEFIKQADAICAQTDGRQRAVKREFWVGHPGVLGTSQFREEEEGWRTDVVEAAVLPQVQEEAEALGRLRRPKGDNEEIRAIVRAMEKAVRKGEAEPVALVGTNAVGPFAKVEEMARAYGFGACAEPL
jgi:hypothetical protein